MMKRVLWFLPVVVLFACASVSHAEIISGYVVAADSDGAITCTSGWTQSTQTLTVTGDQYSLGAGHFLTDGDGFTADSVDDPTVTYALSMDNETGYAWTGYTVTFGVRSKNNNVDLTNLALTPVSVSPSNWSVVSVAPLTKVATYAYNTGDTLTDYYIGTITYAGGTPVNPGDALDITFQASYKGAISYVSWQELTPVPEPATLALLVSGGGLLLVMRRRRRKA
jgi:hypothetical protein